VVRRLRLAAGHLSRDAPVVRRSLPPFARAFRTGMSRLDTRPNFRKSGQAISGHVFGRFPAPVLREEEEVPPQPDKPRRTGRHAWWNGQ